MRVAIDDHVVADRRQFRQIPRHHGGRAAQERERRLGHARHAQRDEPLLPARVDGEHASDGVEAAGSGRQSPWASKGTASRRAWLSLAVPVVLADEAVDAELGA